MSRRRIDRTISFARKRKILGGETVPTEAYHSLSLRISPPPFTAVPPHHSPPLSHRTSSCRSLFFFLFLFFLFPEYTYCEGKVVNDGGSLWL
ncbi:hypothetical protein ACSQ67_023232 [Phaseolus vulgaris]